MVDYDEDRIAVFACKTICFCTFLWISIILFACSFAVLEPVEFGIELNGNTKKLNTQKLYQGGRHLIGLGHGFYKMPANHVMLAFSNWNQLGEFQEDGCSLDDECQLKDNDQGCTYCLEGVASSDKSDLIESSFYVNEGPLTCRTVEGLKITMQATIILRLGIYDDPQQVAEEEIGSESTLDDDQMFYPPQPVSDKLKDSLLGLFWSMGESKTDDKSVGPLRLAAIAVESSIRDQVAQQKVYDFYEKRKQVSVEFKLLLLLLDC